MQAQDNLPEEIILECGEAPKKQGQSYEGHEHSDIGNYAFDEFLEKLPELPRGKEIKAALLAKLKRVETRRPFLLYDPKLEKASVKQLYSIEINEHLELTPGDIVALAGDFFGDPKKPIAFGKDPGEREERFESSYASLIRSPKVTENVKDVVAHIRDDAEAVSPDARWTVKLKKKVYDAVDIGNIKFAYELSDNGFWHSPFFKLALTNFDHFGKEAEKAYLAGHNLALKIAKLAAAENDPEIRNKLFIEALLHELFAAHFLTDLFASGHVRTPRLQILNSLIASNPSNPSSTHPVDLNAIPDLDKVSDFELTLAGFFARKMHDEDNEHGVQIKSPNSDKSWHSLGDNNYYKPTNAPNAAKACDTMLLGLIDIVLAFNNLETKLDKDLSQYIPLANADENERLGKAPLFEVKDNTVICRGNIVQSVKDKGIIAGAKSAIPCTTMNAAYIGCRFFNVKVVPGTKFAAIKVGEAAQTAVEKATEAAQKAQQLTDEAAQALQDQFTRLKPSCNFL